jgi:hypothetical protein
MIVYAHRSFSLEPRRFLVDLRARVACAGTRPSHGVLVEWLVDVGQVEAAVADALMRDVDSDAPDLSAWRDISGGVAAATCASRYGDLDAIPSALHRMQCGIGHVLEGSVPPVVQARAAEGFACYSLYPEHYMSAAEQIVASRRATTVFCLGLRSIGAILAHVVAATLQRAGLSCVVRSARPRGHPFDRHLRLDRSMEKLIESCGCDLYAIVDEGPGISGSSFAAAADQLLALGIARDRIVLLPAWNADSAWLKSPRGRRTWDGHDRYVGDFNAFERYRHWIDLSAGRWRDYVFPERDSEWPAVQPQHERPKFLNRSDGGIARFAGVGKTASCRRTRAEILHSSGFGPGVRELHEGVLELEWIRGVPVQSMSASFLRQAAAYLAVIKSRFATGTCDAVDELAALIETNTGEAGLLLDVETLRSHAVSAGTERTSIDGRMMPHEWIETEAGFTKVDALDHHDDDFFPGCRDIAWDVAGMCVECNLDMDAADYFIGRYRRAAGDVDIARRLPFYEAAYTSYRLGYSRLASETVPDGDDARRFKRLEMAYADRLRRFERSA